MSIANPRYLQAGDKIRNPFNVVSTIEEVYMFTTSYDRVLFQSECYVKIDRDSKIYFSILEQEDYVLVGRGLFSVGDNVQVNSPYEPYAEKDYIIEQFYFHFNDGALFVSMMGGEGCFPIDQCRQIPVPLTPDKDYKVFVDCGSGIDFSSALALRYPKEAIDLAIKYPEPVQITTNGVPKSIVGKKILNKR